MNRRSGRDSPFFIDYTDQIINGLKCIDGFHGYSHNKQPQCQGLWMCFCDKTFVAVNYRIAAGHVKSCGCLKHRAGRNSPCFIDYTGQIFNGLECLDGCRDKGRHIKGLWKCHCGKEFVTVNRNVIIGLTKSCGCLRRRKGDSSPLFSGYADIDGSYYCSIKAGSKSRSLEFFPNLKKRDILKYWWTMFEDQAKKCALSGWPISFGKEQTASLDRIDSSKGYVEGNVQWVHKTINRAKLNMPNEEFIEMCRAISDWKKYDKKPE